MDNKILLQVIILVVLPTLSLVAEDSLHYAILSQDLSEMQKILSEIETFGKVADYVLRLEIPAVYIKAWTTAIQRATTEVAGE